MLARFAATREAKEASIRDTAQSTEETTLKRRRSALMVEEEGPLRDYERTHSTVTVYYGDVQTDVEIGVPSTASISQRERLALPLAAAMFGLSRAMRERARLVHRQTGGFELVVPT